MRDKLKAAFDPIRADERLRTQTLDFLRTQTENYGVQPRRHRQYWRLISATACLALVLLGGGWLYFTPTAAVSIDINPSLQLEVNRFDQVVTVSGRNAEGETLAAGLDLRYLNYEQAVEQVLDSETVSGLLARGEILELGVIGPEGAQTTRILSSLERCTADHPRAHCYTAQPEEAQAAGEMGLSYGKYRAYLILRELDPSVTADQIRDLPMRVLWERIAALSPGSTGAEGGQAVPGRRQGWQGGHGR